MPNSHQAGRRVKQADAANLKNKSDRSKMRTSIKKLLVSIANKKVEEAKAQFPSVQKVLDTLAKKRVIPKNTASRYKSRLNSKIKEIA